MDINYFLLLRSKYNTILCHMDSIIDEFDDTINFSEDNSLNKIFNHELNNSFFVEKKNHILYLKNLCNQYIQNLCNHEFESDTIDITPDESKTISYCKFCEMNEPTLSSFENKYFQKI